MRLAPYIASRASLSRRQAERAILEGRVCVNGVVWKDFLMDPEAHITLDGQALGALPTPRLWSYFKPRGQLVTRDDPQGRPTVFDALRRQRPHGPLVTVGRLDYASEGLLLVTNTPTLAHRLETSGLERVYIVQVRGGVNPTDLDRIQRGCTYEGMTYRPCAIQVQSRCGPLTILQITLTEGKNREIRHLMRSAHLSVQRLMRQSFGPFSLAPNQQPGTLCSLDAHVLC